MKYIQLGVFSLTTLTVGCARDTMVGDWEGQLLCNGQEYDVVARFGETSSFEYEGEMLFSFDKPVSLSAGDGVFTAELLYDFTTHQTARSGGQDIFLDMVWTKLYCQVAYDNGDVQEGGCVNIGGIDDSSKGDKIGYVEMRYSGSDRLSIDDDNCEGTLYWQ